MSFLDVLLGIDDDSKESKDSGDTKICLPGHIHSSPSEPKPHVDHYHYSGGRHEGENDTHSHDTSDTSLKRSVLQEWKDEHKKR